MSFIRREYKFENSTMLVENQKFSAMKSLKKILKPLLRMLKNKQYNKKSIGEILQNNYNASLEDMRKDPSTIEAYADNDANEKLEQRLFDEIKNCKQNAAIYVNNGDERKIVPVKRTQSYVPVHFVRTNNGTFFWTSMETAAICREQELHQQFDRWVQA